MEGHPENRMHQALRSNLSSQPSVVMGTCQGDADGLEVGRLF